MKILHLLGYSPEPPVFGGALRVHHILTHLVRNHDVTVVTFGTSADAVRIREALGQPHLAVHVIPPPWVDRHRRLGQIYSHFTNTSYIQLACISDDMQRLLDHLCASNTYDVILTEFSMMGWYEFKSNAIRILDAHNVEHDLYHRLAQHATSPLRSRHYFSEYKKLAVHEHSACSKQDAIFVTSQRDGEIMNALVPHVPAFVVPNGVQTTFFHPSESIVEPDSLVFTGLMKYVPNYDGMLYFLDEIFPHILREVPTAKLYIVGGSPPEVIRKRSCSNVIVTGFVEDIRPYVWRASAYVVPLRMGGGTRLKILEAMAMKKPIVSTSIGCEGIDIDGTQSVIVADDPLTFAAEVAAILRKSPDANQRAENGLSLVRRKYDWEFVGKAIDDILVQLHAPPMKPDPIEELDLYE